MSRRWRICGWGWLLRRRLYFGGARALRWLCLSVVVVGLCGAFTRRFSIFTVRQLDVILENAFITLLYSIAF